MESLNPFSMKPSFPIQDNKMQVCRENILKTSFTRSLVENKNSSFILCTLTSSEALASQPHSDATYLVQAIDLCSRQNPDIKY